MRKGQLGEAGGSKAKAKGKAAIPPTKHMIEIDQRRSSPFLTMAFQLA
ncbi:hypothetical protein [Sphingorhabdus sp. EL138]|nr:hypothetical protein [Sphingorhabdus sp. EL138]